MAHYAIGDVHGCFDQLKILLNTINFSSEKDTLWFTGDLIARGPKSLEVLRFLTHLPRVISVLGNHDLRLLMYVFGGIPCAHTDTLKMIEAPDILELCHWLRKQPLIHHDSTLGYTLVHAGLAPQWDLKQAITYAQEVENKLKDDDYATFLSAMFPYFTSKELVQWQDDLVGNKRWSCIINYLTRIRFCNEAGTMEFKTKGSESPSFDYMPWFKIPTRKTHELNILFGHWAALQGKTGVPNVYALDTGCERGQRLTAMCLENGQLTSIPCD